MNECEQKEIIIIDKVNLQMKERQCKHAESRLADGKKMIYKEMG